MTLIKNDGEHGIMIGEQAYSCYYFGDSIHSIRYYPKTNLILVEYIPDEDIALYNTMKKIIDDCLEAGIDMDDLPEVTFKAHAVKCSKCGEKRVVVETIDYSEMFSDLKEGNVVCKQCIDADKKNVAVYWNEIKNIARRVDQDV